MTATYARSRTPEARTLTARTPTPRALMAGALTALILLVTCTAAAQQQRTLRIVDGEVYVDDRPVPGDELPDGLRLEGVTAHFTFSGDVRPVVQLGEGFYILDGNRLRVADPSERNRAYFERPPRIRDLAAPDVHVEFRSEDDPMDRPAPPHPSPDAAVPSPSPSPPHAAVFNRKAELLREQAGRLNELQRNIHRHFGEQQIREVERLAQEMSLHAAEAAQMVSDLPRLELETYLEDIRSRNDGLFHRLVSERQLEHETVERARQIRRMTDGEERAEEVDALRAQLDEIFELKQENRRREVQQLERRLEDLEQKLEERERLRGEIVERRLKELLGQTESDW